MAGISRELTSSSTTCAKRLTKSETSPPPEPEEASLTKGQAFFQATAAAVAANPAIYDALESIEDTENVRDLILNFIDSLTRVEDGA